jgi:hypothetical protein
MTHSAKGGRTKAAPSSSTSSAIVTQVGTPTIVLAASRARYPIADQAALWVALSGPSGTP